MRRFGVLLSVAMACAPHDGEDVSEPGAPASEPASAPEPAATAPGRDDELRSPPLDRLAIALREFPEDRQELTLALGARTHRCCYWGADTSRLTTRDGSPPVQWVGPHVPPFVAPVRDGKTLLILDPHADGWLAFYRELFGDPGCDAANPRSRCEYAAAMFDPSGTERWHVELDPLFSTPGLEIDDLHLYDGVLYFNEACPMPNEKGRCGALVAYDPAEKRVRWRSKPHVSDDAFRIAGDRIVAVESIPVMKEPGGTGSLTVLDRATGRTLARREFAGMIDEVTVDRDVIMVDSRAGVFFFRMDPTTNGVRLVEVREPARFRPRTVSLYR
jgi:hypothetical protein